MFKHRKSFFLLIFIKILLIINKLIIIQRRHLKFKKKKKKKEWILNKKISLDKLQLKLNPLKDNSLKKLMKILFIIIINLSTITGVNKLL
jgi:hypothetical protein